eukprot:12905908-Prorocentrum_lima.AAC.1
MARCLRLSSSLAHASTTLASCLTPCFSNSSKGNSVFHGAHLVVCRLAFSLHGGELVMFFLSACPMLLH